MITFENVDVVYPNGFKGLKDITLNIDQGEFVAIIGLSGAGKSTLIRAVNGLVPYTAGTLTVGETVVDPRNRSKLRRLRSRVGMIFQQFNNVGRISVLNNVLIGRSAVTPTWRSLIGWYGAEDKEIAFQSLERVGIVDKAYNRPPRSPAVSSSVWPSLVCSPRTRRSSWPMSRWPRWTRRRRAGCSAICGASSRSWASPAS